MGGPVRVGGTVSVSGGLDSISAPPAAMRAAATALVHAAAELDEAAATCSAGYWTLWRSAEPGPEAGVGPGPAVLAAAAQDTLGGARDELGTSAAALRATAAAVARAAARYESTDHAVLSPVLDRIPGLSELAHVVGWARHVADAPAVRGLERLPGAVATGLALGLATGSARRGWDELAVSDPQLVDSLTGAGLLATLAWPGLRAALSGADAFLEWYYADGAPRVTDAGDDEAIPELLRPRGLGDLIGGLAWRDAHEAQAADTSDTSGGEIDVKFLRRGDGSRSVIVDIPGTKDWSLRGRDPDVTGWASNLRAIGGRPTSYEKGVLTAMHRAGVRPSDHVLLVGHSLGGMIAVEVARDAVRTGRFDVTNVVTAGSPIGRTVGAVPASVQVLALENEHDVVPELDGRANPARPNVVTVRADVPAASPGGAHGLDPSYEQAAEQTARSDDPAVRYYLAGAEEFLDADSVDTHRYLITRSYP